MTEYTSYTITIPKELWKKFGNLVPKNKTYNEAIEELIKEKVKREEK